MSVNLCSFWRFRNQTSSKRLKTHIFGNVLFHLKGCFARFLEIWYLRSSKTFKRHVFDIIYVYIFFVGVGFYYAQNTEMTRFR